MVPFGSFSNGSDREKDGEATRNTTRVMMIALRVFIGLTRIRSATAGESECELQ